MHRPTRKHRNLLAKIERKAAQSRRTGKKARRLKDAVASYVEQSAEQSAEQSKTAA